MRKYRFALLLLCFAVGANGQMEALSKYVEKAWEKWASERIAHDISERAKLKLPAKAAIDKEMTEKTLLIKEGPEIKKETKLSEDIAACTGTTLFVDPYKDAVKAADKAALREFLNPNSTLATVYRAADRTFAAELLKSYDQFQNHPENLVASECECIIDKRIKNPIARGMAKCAVDKAVRNQSCFESFLDN
jgi:hypothetical protein